MVCANVGAANNNGMLRTDGGYNYLKNTRRTSGSSCSSTFPIWDGIHMYWNFGRTLYSPNKTRMKIDMHLDKLFFFN
jgi:hypothetical protein